MADKLTELYKNDKERYESCWPDLATFVKFGCLKDEEFYKRVEDILIYKNLAGEYRPVASFYGEEVSEEDAKNGKEPEPVYYVSDEAGQAQYISMFKKAGLNAIVCDSFIDPHYISYIEFKESGKYRFLRIDADIDAALKEEGGEEDKALAEAFKKALKNTAVAVKTERFKNGSVPAVINVSELSRRFGEMNAFYGLAGADTDRDMTLVLNTANPVVAAFAGLDEEKQAFVANQIYYLAMLSYKKLPPEEMEAFLDNSVSLLEKYIG